MRLLTSTEDCNVRRYMKETMQHPPVPEPVLAPGAFELFVPRNGKGERIGTGTIFEPLRPGLPGETVRGAILKAIFRACRSIQEPEGYQVRLAEQQRQRSLSQIRSQLEVEKT